MAIRSKIPTVESNTISLNGDNQTFVRGGVRLQDTSKIISLMTSNLYAEPGSSVLRESGVSNAIDAIAGNPDGRVDVSFDLETRLLTITDNGTGMSRSDIDNTYVFTGASSKETDLNQMGAYGLGAKSPFSIVDEFTVDTCDGKERTIARIVKDNGGDPGAFILLNEPAADSPSGTTISIVIPEDNVREVVDGMHNYVPLGGAERVNLRITRAGREELALTSPEFIQIGSFNFSRGVVKVLVDSQHNGDTEKSRAKVFGEIIDNENSFARRYPASVVIGGWPYRHAFTTPVYGLTLVVEPGMLDFPPSREEITQNGKLRSLENAVKEFLNNYPQSIQFANMVKDLTIIPNSKILEYGYEYLNSEYFPASVESKNTDGTIDMVIEKAKNWNNSHLRKRSRVKMYPETIKRLWGENWKDYTYDSSKEEGTLDFILQTIGLLGYNTVSVRDTIQGIEKNYRVGESLNSVVARFGRDMKQHGSYYGMGDLRSAEIVVFRGGTGNLARDYRKLRRRMSFIENSPASGVRLGVRRVILLVRGSITEEKMNEIVSQEFEILEISEPKVTIHDLDGAVGDKKDSGENNVWYGVKREIKSLDDVKNFYHEIQDSQFVAEKNDGVKDLNKDSHVFLFDSSNSFDFPQVFSSFASMAHRGEISFPATVYFVDHSNRRLTRNMSAAIMDSSCRVWIWGSHFSRSAKNFANFKECRELVNKVAKPLRKNMKSKSDDVAFLLDCVGDNVDTDFWLDYYSLNRRLGRAVELAKNFDLARKDEIISEYKKQSLNYSQYSSQPFANVVACSKCGVDPRNGGWSLKKHIHEIVGSDKTKETSDMSKVMDKNMALAIEYILRVVKPSIDTIAINESPLSMKDSANMRKAVIDSYNAFIDSLN